MPLIRIVDDDPDVLRGISYLFEGEGYRTATFASAREFLTIDMPSQKGVAIVDLKMPMMDGLELQAELKNRNYPNPIVFLTAHGDIEIAVLAVKRGAFDFLTKPVNPQKLLDVVEKALEFYDRRRTESLLEQSRNLAKLTEKEMQVAKLAGRALSSREIAEALNCSPRTVDAHKASIYKKLGINTSAQLQLLLDVRLRTPARSPIPETQFAFGAQRQGARGNSQSTIRS